METKAINILYFEPSSGFGGSGSALFNLLNNSDKQRFKPFVIVFNDGPQFDKIKLLGIEIMKLNHDELETGREEGLFGYIKFGFDLIVNIIPLALKLAAILKKSKISIVHVNTNVISGISVILAAKINSIPCACHVRQTRLPIRCEKYFMRYVSKFIVINNYMKERYLEYLPADKLSLVYDGIDLRTYVVGGAMNSIRQEFSLGSAPCIGMVSRIIEGKGHDDFIKAAAVVLKIKSDSKFIIVGGDSSKDQNILRRLKNLVNELNLNSNIIFTGWRNDIFNIVSSFDIAVNPYTAPEGLPNIVIEAMALSKPIVTTNIPGPADIVLDGETGFLVPPNQPDALAKAMIELLNKPDLAKRMGVNGRKRVEELFDVRKNVKKIEELYERILGI